MVDGPWKLTQLRRLRQRDLRAQPDLLGPGQADAQEVHRAARSPRTRAEFNALVAGKVDVGYLPLQDVTKPTTNALKAGPNNPPARATTSMDPLYSWSINYFPYNFNSTGTAAAGKIFKQLYFRQAVQYLVDQPLYIKKIYKGYGVGTYGPVPSNPGQLLRVSGGRRTTRTSTTRSKAISLLKDHGWKVVPGGTSTCAVAGYGGQPVRRRHPGRGQARPSTCQYASGKATDHPADERREVVVGPGGDHHEPLSSILQHGHRQRHCLLRSGCSWELENWGAGWIFAPDYYPTGESIFQTGAGSNSGSYSDPTNDANILATNATQTPLTQYENYLAEQLPVRLPAQRGDLA